MTRIVWLLLFPAVAALVVASAEFAVQNRQIDLCVAEEVPEHAETEFGCIEHHRSFVRLATHGGGAGLFVLVLRVLNSDRSFTFEERLGRVRLPLWRGGFRWRFRIVVGLFLGSFLVSVFGGSMWLAPEGTFPNRWAVPLTLVSTGILIVSLLQLAYWRMRYGVRSSTSGDSSQPDTPEN